MLGLFTVVPFSDALSGCEVNWKVLNPPAGRLDEPLDHPRPSGVLAEPVKTQTSGNRPLCWPAPSLFRSASFSLIP